MEEREVAGLSCSQVLARLSDYLDQELTAEERAQVEAHLAGCEGCTRFGGEMGAVVRSLRSALGGSSELSGEVGDRLRARLFGGE